MEIYSLIQKFVELSETYERLLRSEKDNLEAARIDKELSSLYRRYRNLLESLNYYEIESILNLINKKINDLNELPISESGKLALDYYKYYARELENSGLRMVTKSKTI